MSYHGYVLNLDKDKERMQWMASQLARLGIEYTRIPAVLGTALQDEDLARYRAQAPELTPGELGCALSHLAVWKTIAQSDVSHSLVMEDDVHISPHIKNLLESLPISEAQLGILKLEASPIGIDIDRQPTFVSGGYRVHALRSVHPLAGAYIINKVTAMRLLSYCAIPTTPIDLLMFDVKKSEENGIRLLQSLPAPCVQDAFVRGANRQTFASSIGIRPKKPRNMTIVRIKRLLQPIRHLALRVARGQSDIKRIKVEFG